MERKGGILFLKKYSQRKTEYIVAAVEMYFMVGSGAPGRFVACGNFIGHSPGDVMQSYVVPEIEEDPRNGDGHADGEAEVQRTQLFPDVQLVEVLEGNFAFLVPYIAYFRASESGEAVRAFLDEIVSVDDRNVDAVDGGSDGGFRKDSAGRCTCGQGLLEGDVALVDVVGYFRLQEMPVDVDSYEEGPEVTDFVIVLYLVDSHAVDAEVGNEEKGGSKSSFDAKIHKVFMMDLQRFFTRRARCGKSLSPR